MALYRHRMEKTLRERIRDNTQKHLRCRHATDNNGVLQLFHATRKPLALRSVDLAKIPDEVQSDIGDRINEISGKIDIGDLPGLECEPVQGSAFIVTLPVHQENAPALEQ